jgi:hypothetical protein
MMSDFDHYLPLSFRDRCELEGVCPGCGGELATGACDCASREATHRIVAVSLSAMQGREAAVVAILADMGVDMDDLSARLEPLFDAAVAF